MDAGNPEGSRPDHGWPENGRWAESALRTLFEVSPDLLSLLSIGAGPPRYLMINRAFRNYFGVSDETVLGRTDAELSLPGLPDPLTPEDGPFLASGRTLSRQAMADQGGARRWFQVVKAPIGGGNRAGGPALVLVTARDVTLLKTFQEQLAQSQKMEDLGRLAGGVAHEINTPLGVILGLSQLLAEDAPPGSQLADDLGTIERQTKACRKIVADLLAFSRQAESDLSEVDPNRSLREVIALVAPIFRQERVRIFFTPDESIPSIEGDPDKLRQVWMNLLNNAFDAVLQHNPKGGRISVATKLCEKRRRVVVSVTDEGVGVRPEAMRKLFEPFYSTKPVGKGTGLGLSVTFGIIQDHGGRITALSPAPLEYLPEETDAARERGPGATFFVELPIDGGRLPDESCPEVAKALEEARKNALPDQEANR